MPEIGSLADLDETLIDDTGWRRLLELTGNTATLCYQCGVCTATCPWGQVRDQTIPVRSIMRQVQLGLDQVGDMLWICTTCAGCEAQCPRDVDISAVIRGLRYLEWEKRKQPLGLANLLWSIFRNNNPWSQPPSSRSRWAANLGIPLFDPAFHEILLYIGCTASYDRRAQLVALALVSLLRHAGVTFGFLGDDEPCCGEAALNSGHRPYFEEVAQKAAETFEQRGVSLLVTVSPHCYDSFSRHYPSSCQRIEALHYTQYLAYLVKEGRLRFNKPLDLKVTYHDPCYLARHNGEIEAPRTALTAIPSLELIEMERHGLDTLCCGGGGGRMWLETDPGQRFADLRLKEAIATGAQVIATACPFCIACLEDSLKANAITECVVRDIAEIAALGIVT